MRVAAILLAAGSSAGSGARSCSRPGADGRSTSTRSRRCSASPARSTRRSWSCSRGFAVPPGAPRAAASSSTRSTRRAWAPRCAPACGAAPADADAYLVALADMPAVTPELIAALVARYRGGGEGDRGAGLRRAPRPPGGASARSCARRCSRCPGTSGAREILARAPGMGRARSRPDDAAVVFDVDEPADLARRGRAARERRARAGPGQGRRRAGLGHGAPPVPVRLPRGDDRARAADRDPPHGRRSAPRSTRARSRSRACAACAAAARGRGTRWPRRAGPRPGLRGPREPAGRACWRPDVIVDARILKHNLDNRRDDAPLVIGLGPGLEAGRDVHFVVETMRGHDLGRIIASGSDVARHGRARRDRRLHARARAARAGARRLRERARGSATGVAAGDVRRDAWPGRRCGPQIAGVLRGLLWPGLEVTAGFEGRPTWTRAATPPCAARISDKARTISGSVLEIVVAHAGRPAPALILDAFGLRERPLRPPDRRRRQDHADVRRRRTRWPPPGAPCSRPRPRGSS